SRVRSAALRKRCLSLAKTLLGGVKIRTVGRQEKEPCSGCPDRGTDGLAFMAAKIVKNDDIAWLKRGDEDLFDVEPEQLAVDRTVDDPRRVDPVVAQGSEEGHRLPMPIRRLGLEPLTPPAPFAKGRHVIVLAQVSSRKTIRLGSI